MNGEDLGLEILPEAESAAGLNTVSLYLAEACRGDLLTQTQEVALAQQMEAGRAAARKLERMSWHRYAGKWREQVRLGEQARARLITANARLVVSMAAKRCGQGVPFGDLISEGSIGLIRGIDKFDWRRGNKLSTYVSWWIRQALSRAVAEQSRTIRLPVYMHERQIRLWRTRAAFAAENGCEPEVEDMAEIAGETEKQVRHALEAASVSASLDTPIGEDEMSDLYALEAADDDVEADVEAALLGEDLEKMLQEMDALDHRLPKIIRWRFGLYGGPPMTLEQISQRFGLTRERIRQLEQIALKWLRQPERAGRLKVYLE